LAEDGLAVSFQVNGRDTGAGWEAGARCYFSSASFSVAAVSALPLSYQWQLNGVDLPGETNPFLSLKRVTTASEGAYAVVVADANGSVVSPPASLVIPVRPTFVQAPLTQCVVTGGNVTFSAQITGNPAPFTYQWRKGSSLANSTIVYQGTTSEKTAFPTLTNVQPADTGVYRLYLVNAAVPDLTSTSPNRTWTLTVLPDTDDDGLPDEWETAHGLNPASAADAVVDSDGDGLSHLAEFRSGTVPTNAASMFRVETVELGNGQAGVRFTAAANHTYTVERSLVATGGAWVKVVDHWFRLRFSKRDCCGGRSESKVAQGTLRPLVYFASVLAVPKRQ
jgi:hypothetical protein